MFAKKTQAALMLAASAALLGGCASYGMDDGEMASASADTTVMVGGAAMYPTRNIIENAVNSADHTTLVAAVKAAGLVDTLSGPGPFTVFAPTNAAFEKIPADTLNGLLQPEQRDALTGVLTYHVVPGQVDAAALTQQIEEGGGSATLTTVQGGTLTASIVDGSVTLTDEAGNTSRVVTADVAASNGIIHAIDTVVMPN